MKHFNYINGIFDKFSSTADEISGTSKAFLIAFIIVILWGSTGPFANYSNTWQLIINTGTTIVTFLMMFLIRRAQKLQEDKDQNIINVLSTKIDVLYTDHYKTLKATQATLEDQNKEIILLRQILERSEAQINETHKKIISIHDQINK